jgi:hypothetical protein
MSQIKDKQPKRVLIEYEDGTSIELTPDKFENGTEHENLISLLYAEFDGSMNVVRRMLGIPKHFNIRDGYYLLKNEGRRDLDEAIEDFEPPNQG